MSIDTIFIENKTLAGKSIDYEIFSIKPKTLNDISEVSYEMYNELLSIYCYDENKIKDIIKTEGGVDSYYDYIIKLSTKDKDYRNFVLQSLSYFLGTYVFFNPVGFLYSIYKTTNKTTGIEEDDVYVIQSNVFDDIKDIIKIQNRISTKEQKIKENPASDKAREILEKRKKAREKLKKSRGSNDEIGFYDLVSIVASKCNGINILNVWSMNLYQFINQFNRMKINDSYYINMKAIMAGADPEKVGLIHWITKLNDDDED